MEIVAVTALALFALFLGLAFSSLALDIWLWFLDDGDRLRPRLAAINGIVTECIRQLFLLAVLCGVYCGGWLGLLLFTYAVVLSGYAVKHHEADMRAWAVVWRDRLRRAPRLAGASSLTLKGLNHE